MEEEWKVVKEFKGWIMVSSLGRLHFNNSIFLNKYGHLRYLNRINSQPTICLAKSYRKNGEESIAYIYMQFQSKKRDRAVDTLVANEFIKKPCKNAAIRHKNNNALDCRVQNLYWEKLKIPESFKRKTSGSPILNNLETYEEGIRKLQQFRIYTIEYYNKDKEYIKTFYSLRLIQRAFHIPVYNSRIMLITNHNQLKMSYNGNYFKFKYERDWYRMVYHHKLQAQQHVNILQYTLDGILYGEWHDVQAAGELNGLDPEIIQKSCDLDYSHRHYGGYIWRYKLESRAPETIDISNQIYYNEGNKYFDL